MPSLGTARELAAAGRFTEALAELSSASLGRGEKTAHDVLKAELHERLGNHGQSRALLTALLKSKELSPLQRSICEHVLGILDAEAGDREGGSVHLKRAISIAAEHKLLNRLCWSQLHLLLNTSDRSDPGSVGSFLSEIRSNTTRLGDPQVTAALHFFVALMDGKRGVLGNAKRHIKNGQQILAGHSNVWLEGFGENVLVGVAIVGLEFQLASDHARRALELNQLSGTASGLRASLGNLGNLCYWTGDFDKAIDWYQQGIRALPSESANSKAILESLARIRLAQNRLDECQELLDDIRDSMRSSLDQKRFVFRHSLLTRAQLQAHQEQWAAALETVDAVLRLAADAGDGFLADVAMLTKAEFLQQVGRIPDALLILDGLVDRLAVSPLSVQAHYERVLACALAATGQAEAARPHLTRATEIYATLPSAPGLQELTGAWSRASAQAAATLQVQPVETTTDDDRRQATLAVALDASALMLHAGHPDLLARDIVNLLGSAGCVHYAVARLHGENDIDTLAITGDPMLASGDPRRLSVGILRGRPVDVLATPKRDVQSRAALNAVVSMMSAVHEIERARADREEQLTLWPIDEQQTEFGHTVVGGRMREMMGLAKRVANTSVSVLITGLIGRQQYPINHGFPIARGDRHDTQLGRTVALRRVESHAA